MKDKIKNFFSFLGRAWRGGIRGKIGVFFLVFAFLMFIGMFWGDVNVAKFVRNIWHLNAERQELAMERQKLETIQKHIELLKEFSPDYIQELGLKYLNTGDPKFKVLKI